MLKGCLLVLLLVALVLPDPTEGGWFRRWNWRKIWKTVGTVAQVGGVLAAGKRDMAVLDTNGDGVMDVEELANHIGERASRDELENFMLLADADGDGLVTRRELSDMLE